MSCTTISTTRKSQPVSWFLSVSAWFKLLHWWFPGFGSLLVSKHFCVLISTPEVGPFCQSMLQPVVQHDAVGQILNVPNSSCQIQNWELHRRALGTFWPERDSGFKIHWWTGADACHEATVTLCPCAFQGDYINPLEGQFDKNDFDMRFRSCRFFSMPEAFGQHFRL